MSQPCRRNTCLLILAFSTLHVLATPLPSALPLPCPLLSIVGSQRTPHTTLLGLARTQCAHHTPFLHTPMNI